MKQFEFIQYVPGMNLPDKIYNARYNGETALILFKNGEPHFVQFMDNFAKDREEAATPCRIFKKGGIMASSVEVLVPCQEIPVV